MAGWGLANTGAGQPVTVSGTLPFLIQDVHGAELSGLFMFLRITHALAQYATDSSFVEQGVNQRGRTVTEASTSAWADWWRDVWWGGLGDTLSVRKVKAHTTPEAVLAGVITADDRAWNDLADAACKLVVWEHRAPLPERPGGEALGQPGRHWIARIGPGSQEQQPACVPVQRAPTARGPGPRCERGQRAPP